LFNPKVTVMRDAASGNGTSTAPAVAPSDVRTPSDARAAFDSLFKK
jgi:hypothetical protein